MRSALPSLHAPLRVAGRGRVWGVVQLAPLPANLPHHPPPPTPKSELRSSRPRRFAGGGEQRYRSSGGCLKFESENKEFSARVDVSHENPTGAASNLKIS